MGISVFLSGGMVDQLRDMNLIPHGVSSLNLPFQSASQSADLDLFLQLLCLSTWRVQIEAFCFKLWPRLGLGQKIDHHWYPKINQRQQHRPHQQPPFSSGLDYLFVYVVRSGSQLQRDSVAVHRQLSHWVGRWNWRGRRFCGEHVSHVASCWSKIPHDASHGPTVNKWCVFLCH